MKPIQIMMDEKLLDELDADEEVRRLAAVGGILKNCDRIPGASSQDHLDHYRRAYGKDRDGLLSPSEPGDKTPRGTSELKKALGISSGLQDAFEHTMWTGMPTPGGHIPLMSPNMYRRYYKPWHTKLWRRGDRSGKSLTKNPDAQKRR